jgi:tetratricopeptide (TPR) repeat protein
MAPPRLRLCAGLALVTLTLVVYRPVGGFGLINLDDPDYIQDNPLVFAGLTPAAVYRAFTTVHAGYWIPLTWVSYQLDYQLSGLAAGGYHRTNLLLHAANVLLLFTLLCRMTGATLRSGFAAALFAVHPLQVESVAWVTERKDVLSTFFGLLTLHAYVAYAANPGLLRYLLVLLWLALGLMAKPMLVTLPCVLLLLDYWPLKRVASGQWLVARGESAVSSLATSHWPLATLLLEKLPLFLVAGAASLMTVIAQRQGGAVRSLAEFSFAARAGNAVVSYVRYLGKEFWPFNLGVFYPHPGDGLPAWQVAASALLLGGVTVLVLWRARRQPYLAVGWLWLAGTLIPVSGVLQAGYQGMADRFVYVPGIGLFIVVSWGLADLAGRVAWSRRAAAGVAVAVLALLCLRTAEQVGYWRDSLALWGHTVRVTPDNFQARDSYGIALLDAGQVKQAEQQLTRAVALRPEDPLGHYHLGLAWQQQGRTPDAIASWTKALRLAPDFLGAHVALAEVLAEQGDPRDAEEHAQRALAIAPDDAAAHHALGLVRRQQGQRDKAMACFQRAVQLNPHAPRFRADLISFLSPQR